MHPPARAGTAAYPATLFTDAPLGVLQQAVAAVSATSKALPAPPAPQPLLSLQQLSYSTAGGWPCVAGLSLDVVSGGAVLVEGRSGCGKSTLVRVLAGLHPLQSGTFQLPPRDQVSSGTYSSQKDCQQTQYGPFACCLLLAAYRRQPAQHEEDLVQVMLLPQQALTAPGATLWDQLSYGCSQPATPQQMVDSLRRVGLQHLMSRTDGGLHLPADWSGTGSRTQRVCCPEAMHLKRLHVQVHERRQVSVLYRCGHDAFCSVSHGQASCQQARCSGWRSHGCCWTGHSWRCWTRRPVQWDRTLPSRCTAQFVQPASPH